MKYLFELRFKSSTHFGSDIAGYGVEDVQGMAHSDTIFSAFINALVSNRNTFNYCWLQNFLLSESRNVTLPFKLSSFGFVNYIGSQYRYFIPKPLFIPGNLTDRSDYENLKRFKNADYISIETYLDIINGKTLDLAKIIEHETNPLWTEHIRTQNRTDAVSSHTEIYSVGEIFYEKSVNPFILVELNESEFPLDDFINLLKLVGSFGLGGRRTSGSGVFEFSDNDWFCIDPETKDEVKNINPGFNPEKNIGRVRFKDVFSKTTARRYLFSTLFPNEFNSEDLYAYQMVQRKGWIYSTSSFNQLKRKTCYMFGEGSVLNREITGKLVDVTPGEFNDHKVWRYGIPFYLPYTDLQ